MTELRTAKPVPAWLNIDALDITEGNIELIESTTEHLRALLPTAMSLGNRIALVFELRDRLDVIPLDDAHSFIGDLFGIDQVEELVGLISFLLTSPDGYTNPQHALKVAERYESECEGLTGATQFVYETAAKIGGLE